MVVKLVEKIKPLPLTAGIIAAVLILVLFDLVSMGMVPDHLADATARETAVEWLNANKLKVTKGVEGELVSLGANPYDYKGESFVPVSVEDAGRFIKLKKVTLNLVDEKTRGQVEVMVDLRTNGAAGVGAHVTQASLKDVGTKEGAVTGKVTKLASNPVLMKGRVRYYLNAFSSAVWHLIVAGLLFGIVRLTKLGPKTCMLISLVVSIVIIDAITGFDPAWTVGSWAIAAMGAAWAASEFKRIKRHKDVLKLIWE
jgi:hypothetical protein